jgi:dUTP pyrophosphatase
MELKIICNDSKLMPNYSYDNAAAFDLSASGEFIIDLDGEKKEIKIEEYILKPGERILAKTGVKIGYPKGTWGNIRGRSGLAMKQGISILGGVIDESYTGEHGVIMLNTSKKDFVIKKYDRIAQLIICKYYQPEIIKVEELNETIRGEKGFGPSGK